MKNRIFLTAAVAAILLAAFGYGLYRLGVSQGMSMPSSASVPSNESGSKKPLYWHDPMVPGTKFDKPGKSPFMDMQLVPVYADDAGGGQVAINPRVQQNLGIRTAEVTKGSLSTALTAVGSVAWNERDVALVQARSNGFVERLAVRAPLDPVKKGQILVQLYVPDWIAVQEEFLSVSHMQGPNVGVLRDGARQRMRLAGMNDDQIRLVESTGKVQSHVAITAPLDGVIAELSAREGMTVMAGAPLFRINGLSTVWINADVPENAAGRLMPGMPVEARTPALPDHVFKGKVSAILPEVNLQTRTVKARIELANPGGRLVPGMFATLAFAPMVRSEVLLVPSEAIIRTGKRNVVMLVQKDGFMPVDVELGAEANGQTEIRNGLQAGQKVVTSGQFLIDSEASLKGTSERMGASPTQESVKATSPTHHGSGKVEKIDLDGITISHGPIPTLQWGPMTMGFQLPAGGLPRNVAVGDSVVFGIRETPDGQYQITTITPTADAPGAAK